MNKNESDLNKNQYIQEHFKKTELTNIKELTIGREKKLKNYINEIQNGVINFCINYNNLQHENNFFSMKMNNQFKFNECIDKSVGRIERDFATIEKYYLKCKNKCLEKFPRAEESLNEYLQEGTRFLKKSLNPCLLECQDFFSVLHNNYFQYMIKSK